MIEEVVEEIQEAEGGAAAGIRNRIWAVLSGGSRASLCYIPLFSGLTNQVKFQATGDLGTIRYEKLQNGENLRNIMARSQFMLSSSRKRRLIKRNGGRREKLR